MLSCLTIDIYLIDKYLYKYLAKGLIFQLRASHLYLPQGKSPLSMFKYGSVGSDCPLFSVMFVIFYENHSLEVFVKQQKID